jgi:hypothetical protein
MNPAKLPTLPDTDVATKPAGNLSRNTTFAPDPLTSASPRFDALTTSVPLSPGGRFAGIDSESSCHHGAAAIALPVTAKQIATTQADTTRALFTERTTITP